LPVGSSRLHPGGGRRAPQHARAEPLSAKFVPRVTPRRAAVPSALVPQAYVFRPSRRDRFVQGGSHLRRGHAHPSAQGHGYSMSLLVPIDARRHRVLVWGVDTALCVSDSQPSRHAGYFCRYVCARVLARAHPSAKAPASPRFCMHTVAFDAVATRRRALLAAPTSSQTRLCAVRDWMVRGSCMR
jgi:hypothetical protein